MDDPKLELLKEFLGIDTILDNSKDLILNFYISKAISSIKKYSVLTQTEYDSANLITQTVELALYYYQNKKIIGIKNEAEGSKSKSYEVVDIPTSIKATLPPPAIYSA